MQSVAVEEERQPFGKKLAKKYAKAIKVVEREMGFEPTTFCLGSRRSATELLPLECP
jgi:hypothetical protein